jgi:hypothetical protein
MIQMTRITKADKARQATVIALDAKRREADLLKKEIGDLQDALLEQLGDLKSFTVEADDGRTLRATRVQSTSWSIDEPALQTELGATTWNRVTTRVLDRKKLEAYIASGDIDPVVVASVSTEKTNKPFIRLSDRG